MSNTIIQIKRSSVTATPAGGSLSPAELAYSYSSDKLFIGSANGLDVIAIGGKFYNDLGIYAADTANVSFDRGNGAFTVANAAFDAANSAGSLAVINTIFSTANSAWDTGNAAFTRANTAWDTGNAAFTEANSATTTSGAAFDQANLAYGVANNALPTTGGSLSGDLSVNGNLTITGVTTYANVRNMLVGDNIVTLNAQLPGGSAPLAGTSGFEVNRGTSANTFLVWDEGTTAWSFTNNGTNYYQIASNTSVINVASGANAYADLVGTAANANAAVAYSSAVSAGQSNAATAYASAVAAGQANAAVAYSSAVSAGQSNAATAYASAVAAALGYANSNAATVYASALGYANVVGSAANTNAADGSYISTGIVKVTVGGTGVTSFTGNGVLYGNNSGSLKVTGAGTEGQVLQADASGVPNFGMLDGGSF